MNTTLLKKLKERDTPCNTLRDRRNIYHSTATMHSLSDLGSSRSIGDFGLIVFSNSARGFEHFLFLPVPVFSSQSVWCLC
ncbi:MAG: hypothetical protein PVI41_01745, partial [Roseobacter sp.]